MEGFENFALHIHDTISVKSYRRVQSYTALNKEESYRIVSLSSFSIYLSGYKFFINYYLKYFFFYRQM